MNLADYTELNHAEFVEWFQSGKARRMTSEEASGIVAAVVERARHETLTREQVRVALLDAGIWLAVDPRGIDEWILCVRPIFVTLEGTLQKMRDSASPG